MASATFTVKGFSFLIQTSYYQDKLDRITVYCYRGSKVLPLNSCRTFGKVFKTWEEVAAAYKTLGDRLIMESIKAAVDPQPQPPAETSSEVVLNELIDDLVEVYGLLNSIALVSIIASSDFRHLYPTVTDIEWARAKLKMHDLAMSIKVFPDAVNTVVNAIRRSARIA